MEKKLVLEIKYKKKGNWDKKIGKILLKGFIHALTMQEVLPKTIVFYNDGVFVTTEGSESLEDLSYLEE